MPPVRSRKRSARGAIDSGRRHHAGAGRGKFDGQGNAVQALTDAGHDGELRSVGVEPGARQRRPVDEEPRARLLVEGRDHPSDLALRAQMLPAGGQHLQVRSRPQEPFRQFGAGTQYVLAVVQHEQGLRAGELLAQGLDDWPTTFLRPQPEGAGHDVVDDIRIGHRRQLDPSHSIGIAVGDVGGGVQGKAGLAATAGSGQRHQPALGQQ